MVCHTYQNHFWETTSEEVKKCIESTYWYQNTKSVFGGGETQRIFNRSKNAGYNEPIEYGPWNWSCTANCRGIYHCTS